VSKQGQSSHNRESLTDRKRTDFLRLCLPCRPMAQSGTARRVNEWSQIARRPRCASSPSPARGKVGMGVSRRHRRMWREQNPTRFALTSKSDLPFSSGGRRKLFLLATRPGIGIVVVTKLIAAALLRSCHVRTRFVGRQFAARGEVRFKQPLAVALLAFARGSVALRATGRHAGRGRHARTSNHDGRQKADQELWSHCREVPEL
jgi:hypothetical protein